MFSRAKKSASYSNPSSDIELKLDIECCNLLYKQNIQGLIALVVYGSSYLYATRGTHSDEFLWIWGGAGLLGSFLLRAGLTIYWHRKRGEIKDPKEVRTAMRNVQIMLFFSGILWGTIAWMMPSMETPTSQIITCLVVILMAAGAIVAYSSSLTATLMVFFPALVPLCASLLLTGTPDYQLMGSMLFIYMLLGFVASRNLNRYVVGSLKLAVENASLTEGLREQIAIKDRSQEELRESQERLNLALEASGAATWTWSPDKNSFCTEGNLKTLFGKQERAWETTLDEYLEQVHVDDRLKLKRTMEEALSSENDFEVEHRVIGPDQQLRHVALRGAPSKIGPRRLNGISWDVTDKHAQENLRRERSEHEAASRAKSVFLANASHEIRTPLAAINGFAYMLLQNRDLPVEARTDLEMILRNGKYLVSLVSDLLDLSKIESGQIYIQQNIISVADEVKDIVALMKPTIEGKGLAIEVDFQTWLPEQIRSDLTRFREILINLLTNAAKFTERGSIRITVAFDHLGNSSGALRIRVSDTGIGIPHESAKLLFRPFTRGDSDFVQRVQGSGLGLALSRNLAQLLGGDLKLIDSSERGGSIFELALTVDTLGSKLVNPSEKTGTIAPSEQVMTQQRKLEGRRILIVDDSKDLLILMKRFLEKQGAQIEVCHDGQEALEHVSKVADYDIILMDIKMPKLDGYTATSRLRRSGYTRPIVAITAHASTDDRQRCYQSGFDSYISKPVDFASLVNDLQRL